MKRGKVIWIVLAVAAAHVGAFFLLGKMRALPPSRSVPPPNFSHREEESEDPATGAKIVYREYRVSTKLTPLKRPGDAKPKPGGTDASHPL